MKFIIFCITLIISNYIYSQDVRFIVDESGSMQITDPQRLKIPALKLITHLLPNTNKAGIWGFSSNVREIVPLGPVDSKWRQQTKFKANKIKSNGRYTNIGKAIDSVSQDWFNKPVKEDRIIILLTDGKVDVADSPEKNINAKKWLLQQLIPKLKENKISIYTIGLSNKVDESLLKKLSYRTNGTFQLLESARDLQDTYYNIFNSAVDSNEIPITDGKFKIDSQISEVTLILMKKNEHLFSLIMPNKKKFNLEKAKNHSTDKYIFLTIAKPIAGTWFIKNLKGKENRALIVSDLDLAIRRFQPNLFAGEKIITFAYLTNLGKRLTNNLLIENTEISISLGKNKNFQLNKPNDFEINYRKIFYIPKDIQGTLLITFKAISKTFDRIKTQLVKIEKFPFKITFRRKNRFEMNIQVLTSNSSIKKSYISGEIKYQTKKEVLNFKQYSSHKYYAKYKIACINENYDVTLKLNGTKLNQDLFEFKPQKYSLKCRKKILLKSHIEHVDSNQLKKKPSLIKRVIKKVVKKIETKIAIMPIVSIILFLSVISGLIMFLSAKKRKSVLSSILKELDSKDNNDVDDKSGEKKS